ncbi:hypothetical protein B0H14DRAFT_2599691 [Mycena olivaceomarginata]|nr:hypothetical protein B0H14DRAFT_2599691 [Mycena olivaceomarginata]
MDVPHPSMWHLICFLILRAFECDTVRKKRRRDSGGLGEERARVGVRSGVASGRHRRRWSHGEVQSARDQGRMRGQSSAEQQVECAAEESSWVCAGPTSVATPKKIPYSGTQALACTSHFSYAAACDRLTLIINYQLLQAAATSTTQFKGLTRRGVVAKTLKRKVRSKANIGILGVMDTISLLSLDIRIWGNVRDSWGTLIYFIEVEEKTYRWFDAVLGPKAGCFATAFGCMARRDMWLNIPELLLSEIGQSLLSLGAFSFKKNFRFLITQASIVTQDVVRIKVDNASEETSEAPLTVGVAAQRSTRMKEPSSTDWHGQAWTQIMFGLGGWLGSAKLRLGSDG